jgi:hypothetical protein
VGEEVRLVDEVFSEITLRGLGYALAALALVLVLDHFLGSVVTRMHL